MKFRIIYTDRARKIAERMSVRELLNQVVCPAYANVSPKDIDEFGGAFFHSENLNELEVKIKGFKNKCTVPPLIVSDFENGPGSMIIGATKFPSMMGCSQADSEELAYEMGRIAAEEGSTLGYNWTLAPVADLSAEMDSPVVSSRSAGQDPEHNIKILAAYIKGLQEHGMMATIKHFPGDGFGTIDQHLATPVNPLDREQWYKQSGRVFQALIDDGVMAVMPGHIALPAFDEVDSFLGLYPPATFSKKILTDLLRNELGFEGLIISDAINMGGAVGFMRYYEGCARFFESGGDMLLFPRIDEAYYVEMENLIKAGVLQMETLVDRAVRIISLKDQMGLLDGREKCRSKEINSAAHKALSNRMVEGCITVVRDRLNVIPYNICKNTKVLHLVIMNNYEHEKEIISKLTYEIRRYSDFVEEMVDPGPSKIFETIYSKAYDIVICSIGNKCDYGINVARLHGPVARNMMEGWMKLGTPVVFVSHNHPFIHKEYEASIDTIINTYGSIEYSMEYLLKGITGEAQLKRTIYVHD